MKRARYFLLFLKHDSVSSTRKRLNYASKLAAISSTQIVANDFRDNLKYLFFSALTGVAEVLIAAGTLQLIN